MAAVPARHQPDQVRRQDLSTIAEGAESGGLYHRVPEVVVAFSSHLSTANSNTEAHRIAALMIAPLDALLHGYSAGQRSGGGPKDHHQPIAQVLHLGAAHLGDRLAQQGKMLASDQIGEFRRLALGQLRRPDDVGEQNRDALGHRSALSTITPTR